MSSALTDLIDTIRGAAAGARALRIRAGGTKDFYGESLGGEILDLRGLRGIVSYEPSELVVTVRAGTPLAELEALLSGQGQYLAFEPPHFGAGATVGGMVAAGLSGPARAAVGGVRDYVLGVQMLNGQAQLLSFGGQVMKNVAGYDVSRLMAGSLGTLGVITEVSLKVLPLPVAQATLQFEYDQAAALRQLNRWAGQPLPVNASCWGREQGQPGVLKVRLRGAQAAVQAACRDMGGERLDDERAEAGWRALREQTLAFFACDAAQGLWRLAVPDTTAPMQTGPGETLLEWGGAVRWVKAPAARAAELRAGAGAAGGSATLFRRALAPDATAAPVFHPLSAPLLRIQRELKQQFDPAGIFNRARMFPDF